MNSDKDNQIIEGLRKQLDRSASYEEKKRLASDISSLTDKDIDEVTTQLWDNHTPQKTLSEEQSQRILSEILNSSAMQPKRNSSMKLIRRAVAIAASILLVAAAGLYFYQFEKSIPHYKVIAKALNVSPAQPANFNRNITLPDGSTVILKQGSRLIYPKQFTGKTREVELQGEAYFDIRHKETQPFVIHTGSVKTTVLGTAFNIKADNHGVVVSVTRGRVRVEKNGQTMAVLGVNEEIACINNNEVPQQQQQPMVVPTTESTQWVKEGMEFDHTPMTEVAQILSRRYNVNIAVNSKEIEKLIFISNFTGTESLDEVLSVLCSLMPDMNYKIEGNNVSIYQSKNK
jgi:ferric-dicitrate binding protein FerR (iron transport regulator)